MNLCEISFKVKSGSYKLFDSERTKSSSVWNTFKLVKNDKDEIIFGVACCKNCYCCFIFKKEINGSVQYVGTNSLIQHNKSCKKSSNTQSTISFAPIKPKKVDPKDINKVKNRADI